MFTSAVLDIAVFHTAVRTGVAPFHVPDVDLPNMNVIQNIKGTIWTDGLNQLTVSCGVPNMVDIQNSMIWTNGPNLYPDSTSAVQFQRITSPCARGLHLFREEARVYSAERTRAYLNAPRYFLGLLGNNVIDPCMHLSMSLSVNASGSSHFSRAIIL